MSIPTTPQEVLLQAADLIETVGFTKRDYGSPDRGYCSLGAISQVVWGDPVGPVRWDTDEGEFDRKCDLQQGAVDLLRGKIGSEAITTWNDQPRRKAASVVKTFRKAAK